MSLVKVNCSFCNKVFYRQRRRYNEALKFNWKQYCSLECQRKAKYKQVEVKCSNPNCRNTFKRTPSQVSKLGNFFCSSSCAAVVNNSWFPKKLPKIKTCPSCKKEYVGRHRYCSSVCYPKRSTISKKTIIVEIQNFFIRNNRIPFKKEYHAYKMARFYFGSWNKAIEEAGFKPNPVKFSKKHIAQDGHLCDSLSEKIIDDWLLRNNIPHKVNVPYLDTKFTADFKVNDYYIEFFGLHNGLDRYNLSMKEKIRLIKQNHLKLIAIYPKDIFPESKLDTILKVIK